MSDPGGPGGGDPQRGDPRRAVGADPFGIDGAALARNDRSPHLLAEALVGHAEDRALRHVLVLEDRGLDPLIFYRSEFRGTR